MAGKRSFAVDTGFITRFGEFNIEVKKSETFVFFILKSAFKRIMYTIEFIQIFFGFCFETAQRYYQCILYKQQVWLFLRKAFRFSMLSNKGVGQRKSNR